VGEVQARFDRGDERRAALGSFAAVTSTTTSPVLAAAARLHRAWTSVAWKSVRPTMVAQRIAELVVALA
jgi:hypothetical protein